MSNSCLRVLGRVLARGGVGVAGLLSGAPLYLHDRRTEAVEGDPLGVEDFATHRISLDEAPAAYETFQKKEDGCIKVVLKP